MTEAIRQGIATGLQQSRQQGQGASGGMRDNRGCTEYLLTREWMWTRGRTNLIKTICFRRREQRKTPTWNCRRTKALSPSRLLSRPCFPFICSGPCYTKQRWPWGLAPLPSEPDQQSVQDLTNTLFLEHTSEAAVVPSPKMFVDLITRQWASLGAGPNPTSAEKTIYNVAPDLAKSIQVPSIDAPVAALHSSSSLPGDPAESLRPEDRRSEQSLQRAHQAAAWAIRASTTASFLQKIAHLASPAAGENDTGRCKTPAGHK